MSRDPLVVDLDGTVLLTDTLHESALRALRECPLHLALALPLVFKSKALVKRHLSINTELDPSILPYNENLLNWLTEQRKLGRRLVLCTGADTKIANQIAGYLGLFDEVMASSGTTNLSGEKKANALVARFGHRGFDYAGNGTADLHVWACARKAIVVNASANLIKKARSLVELELVVLRKPTSLDTWLSALRVHQWLKNLLLFIPLLASHDLANGQAWAALLVMFVAFSLCASSVYLVNDLLDLESDRRHQRKRDRPFASGSLPVWNGLLLAPVLLVVSAVIALTVSTQFFYWVIFYFSLTCAYSWVLKRVMLIDCLTLALLYTVRVVAGAAVIGHGTSFWLLAFSVFLFLSLAFLKRYTELEATLKAGSAKVHGRGYLSTDTPLIQTMGITSGYLSVLVLALYLNSDAVLKLYAAPHFIWGAIPIMLFWVSWMWLQAHRRNMQDDPLVFAIKDPASLAAGTLFAVVLVAGSVGSS